MSDASGTPASRQAPGTPPGLRDQLGATFGAGKRLIGAHVDLGKAELGEIVDEVKRTVALAGMAIGVLVLAALLLLIGGFLFLGEWLFGSIGWGVLLGTLLLVDVAVVALLLALDVRGGRLGSSFLIAAVLGVAVGVVLALDLPHLGWDAVSRSIATSLDFGLQTTLIAVGALAALGALVGLVLGSLRGGLRAGLGLAIALAVLGAFIGWLTSIAIAPQVGAALGVLVALIAWPVLAGREVISTGVDADALQQKFIPNETINLTKETIEWVRARTPLAPRS